MKKIPSLFLLILISLNLFNCASGKQQMNGTLNNVYVGMTISEFNKIVPKKEIVSMRDGLTVYKVSYRVCYVCSQNKMRETDGTGVDFRFYYFEDNELLQIDKGERAVDRRIRIDKN